MITIKIEATNSKMASPVGNIILTKKVFLPLEVMTQGLQSQADGSGNLN